MAKRKVRATKGRSSKSDTENNGAIVLPTGEVEIQIGDETVRHDLVMLKLCTEDIEKSSGLQGKRPEDIETSKFMGFLKGISEKYTKEFGREFTPTMSLACWKQVQRHWFELKKNIGE